MTAAQRVLVLGFGMAGGRFVDEVLARETDGRARRASRLTVVGAEPYQAYNRVLLSDVVAGRADVTALTLGDADTYAAHGVDVRLATRVTHIDRERGLVGLDDESVQPFDRIVLALGAEPVVPQLPVRRPVGGDTVGPPPTGVHVLRTIDDAREIVAAGVNARRAVVLGGGLLGLEAARGLARRGLQVTVLGSGPGLLPGRLDAAAAEVLRRTMERLGVSVLTLSTATALHADTDGRLCAVTVGRPGGATNTGTGPGTCPGDHTGTGASGDSREPTPLEAELLVIACGVRPSTALAVHTGLSVGRGVRIGDDLATSDPRILAIGDCTEHAGQTPGLVAPAWDQARVAADLVAGADPTARYRPRQAAVRLKAADLEVAMVGETATDVWDGDDDLEVVQLLQPAQGRYVKAVVRAGTVAGAVVIGDARAAAELTLMVERGSAAPVERALLTVAGTAGSSSGPDAVDPTHIPDRATICRCNGVTKGALVRAWTAGARTPAAIAATTRATTGCGTCTGAVEGIAAWLAGTEPQLTHPTGGH
jgi:assimilatory nitrate reductase electron transfer subunit